MSLIFITNKLYQAISKELQVGEKIARIRTMKGLTQAAVAKALCMHVGSYSKFEQRGDDLTVAELKAIAKVLSAELADFLLPYNDSKILPVPLEENRYEKRRKIEEKEFKNDLNQISIGLFDLNLSAFSFDRMLLCMPVILQYKQLQMEYEYHGWKDGMLDCFEEMIEEQQKTNDLLAETMGLVSH